MTHKERKELLERRMTLCRRVFICSFIALGIINSPNVMLANCIFGALFGLSILYGFYNFYLELHTDAYKDEPENDDNKTNDRIMKVRVRIDGYIDIDEENVTEKQIEEAVYFQLGMGCLSNDNLVGEPEWDYADVEIDM